MKPNTRRFVTYDGHKWEVTDERAGYLYLERGRGAHARWVAETLVT